MNVLVAEGVGVDDFELKSDQFPATIGRKDDCTVHVEDAWTSREHCRIDYDGTKVVVKDLSRNGTIVNGKKIEQVELSAGDMVFVGRVGFRVRGVKTEESSGVHGTTMASPPTVFVS